MGMLDDLLTSLQAQPAAQPRVQAAPQAQPGSPWGVHSGSPGAAPLAPSSGLGIGPMLLMMSGDPGSAKVGETIAALGQAREQQTQSMRYMVSKGVDPQAAQIMARDPAAVRAWIEKGMEPWQFKSIFNDQGQEQHIIYNPRNPSQYQTIGGAKKESTGATTEFEYSNKNPGFLDFLQKKSAAERAPIQIDHPTQTMLIDPRTFSPIGAIPKGVAEAESEKQRGEAQGKAMASLPTVETAASYALKTINDVNNHPGKQNWGAFGLGAKLPDVPGSKTYGFGALVEQLKGKAFQQAFDTLRGAGAISEKEGEAATRAIARLDRAQSRSDFDAALLDLQAIIKSGVATQRRRAGLPVPDSETMAPGFGGAPPPAGGATRTGGAALPPGFQLVK